MQQEVNVHRFQLEKYSTLSSRYTCPSCGQKRQFVRYIDTEGKFEFPENVGKCNRKSNCGYHYTPREYFADNPEAKKEMLSGTTSISTQFETKQVDQPKGQNSKTQSSLTKSTDSPPSFVDREVMERTLSCYHSNNFVKFLHTLYDDETVRRMLARYHVGTSRRWNGATVFWQVDEQGRVHHGKVMVYDAVTGRRSHRQFSTAESLMHITNFHLQQCFFGEHLLIEKKKPIALVESEKSAIIAAEHMQQFLWLASGGSSGCINQRMHILSGRQVVMFPDMKCLAEWEMKSNEMRRLGAKVEVSTFLEENATEEELAKGLDIADYIIAERQRDRAKEQTSIPIANTIASEAITTKPPLQILIDKLDLEPIANECIYSV